MIYFLAPGVLTASLTLQGIVLCHVLQFRLDWMKTCLYGSQLGCGRVGVASDRDGHVGKRVHSQSSRSCLLIMRSIGISVHSFCRWCLVGALFLKGFGSGALCCI